MNKVGPKGDACSAAFLNKELPIEESEHAGLVEMEGNAVSEVLSKGTPIFNATLVEV